jgi:hypothetical protein
MDFPMTMPFPKPGTTIGLVMLCCVTLASGRALATETDHDGRWRLEYSCGQNSSNGAPGFSARIEFQVEGGRFAARVVSRNARMNREDTDAWSGGFTGRLIGAKVVGSASDGTTWDYEWNGSASSPGEAAVTGGVFGQIRGTRTRLRDCTGTMTLVAPAPASLAGMAAASRRAAEEESARQRAAEEASARQRATEAAAARQREAEEESARQRAAEEASARQRATEAATARQRETEEDAARQRQATVPARVPAQHLVSPRTDVLASDPLFRRDELRRFKNKVVEANADHRELDIVLYLRKSATGGIQRTMAGEFVLAGQQPVCVDVRPLESSRPAIPLARLAPGPKVARGALGLAGLEPLTQSTARAAGLNMPSFGAPIRIGRVAPGSPAAQAGLRDGDIMLTIDGQHTYPEKFIPYFAELLPGRVVRFEVWRILGPGEADAAPGPVPREQLRASGRNQEPPPTGRKVAIAVTLGERVVDMPGAPTHMAAGELYRALRLSPPRLFSPEMDRNAEWSPADRALHADWDDDLAAVAREMMATKFGAEARLSLLRDERRQDGCGAMLAPRAISVGEDEWIQAAELAPAGLRTIRAGRLHRIAQQREAWRAFVDEMARSAPGGEGALYGALSIVKTRDKPSGWFSPCVVAPSGAHVPGRGMRVDMVARAPAFREQVLALGIGRYHGSDELRPAKQFDSLDALFVHVKSAENACNVVLANGPTLAALRETLARDGERAQLLPVRVTEAELAELHASALGFRAIGQRSAVYAWEFAREIGGLTPAHVEALFGLGVDTLDAVDEALARHEDEHKLGPMRDDAQVLIDFLEDEREARAKRTTILRLRADREALALRQAAEAARAHREAEMRRAAEFPFVARIACAIGNTVTPIQACMSSDGLTTELELQNGRDYRMYKLHDVSQAGTQGSQGLEIELRRSFDLRISNASETLVLTVVVLRREDGREVFRRSAARFGALRVTN